MGMLQITELEIAVSHWPFSEDLAEQSRTNLLYISNVEAISL